MQRQCEDGRLSNDGRQAHHQPLCGSEPYGVDQCPSIAGIDIDKALGARLLDDFIVGEPKTVKFSALGGDRAKEFFNRLRRLHFAPPCTSTQEPGYQVANFA